jgi:3-methyladenine DNA glycosylase AlkD
MTKSKLPKWNARTVSALLTEILAGPTVAAPSTARYVGAQGHEDRASNEQSTLRFWGHKSATIHDAARRAATQLRACGLSPAEEFRLWRSVWDASDLFELKTIALGSMTSKRLRSYWLVNPLKLFALAPQIDNWALSDTLSDVLAELLESDRGHLAVFQRWNSSHNPWLRRQSIVGLYYYARMRKKPLAVCHSLPLVNNLLDDPHFYVQRGVGWTLREIDRVHSQAQRRFVRANLSSISPVAWFAASELYPRTLRTSLAVERKAARSERRRMGGGC